MKVTNLVKSSSLFFKIMTNQSSKRYSFTLLCKIFLDFAMTILNLFLLANKSLNTFLFLISRQIVKMERK